MSAEPEKLGVIYNPKAGTRKVQKRWKEIKEYMDSKGVPYDYVQSEGFGSVERLAGILANNGYRALVVVGGDGALNDVINGIMLSNAPDKENIAIGIIPNGIGNDFADYWEMSSDYKKAVDCIINNRRRKIDVGTCYYYDGEKHLTQCHQHSPGSPYRENHRPVQAFLGSEVPLLLHGTAIHYLRTEAVPHASQDKRRAYTRTHHDCLHRQCVGIRTSA